METIVNNIIQFNRGLSQGEDTKKADEYASNSIPIDDSDLQIDDDFFDEPQGISFLNSDTSFMDIEDSTLEEFQSN